MRKLQSAKIRIAVTGSRGKSTVVRMLHRALVSCGLECRTRLTGVVPRELSNIGSHIIARHAGAHVEELKWWLSQLPQSTEAVVSENSAVSPHLQHVCPMYLMPHVTILTNALTMKNFGGAAKSPYLTLFPRHCRKTARWFFLMI